MKRCQQCKRLKESTEFPREVRRMKARFCWECAGKNMAIWARTQNVGMTEKDIQSVD